jgi:hypothetical protein
MQAPGLPNAAESALTLAGNLDAREIELLIVALRYWRTHRIDGITRRSDRPMTPDTIDSLLAKLASSATAASLERSDADS